MKLNILIVDDEPKVLRGIRTIINRANEEWNVICECKNGVEALEVIADNYPDVVITDIKMPCMDGLELVEKAKNIAPEIKFIILSGFPDFSFAQQAIRLETVDYILKPPDYRDILKSLEKAEQQLEERKAKINEQEELNKFKKQTSLQSRDRFFLEMLYKTEFKDLQQEEVGIEGLEIFNKRYALFVIRLDNFSFFILDENDKKLEELANFRKEVQDSFYRRSGCVVDLYDGTYCCLLSVNNESKVYLKGLANEIHGELSESRNEGLTIGVSRAYNEPEEINTAYKECLSILRNKVFFEKNSVVYIDELKEENSSEDYPLELEHKYIESLRFANLGKSIDILTAIIEKIILISNKEPTVFKSMIMEFIIVVARNLSEERTLEKTYPVPMKSIYSKLNSLDNMNDIKDLLSDYTKLIVDYFNERNKPGCRKIINDIKGYVNSNYFEDITLRQIANEFFMNESYLSDLFKKEAGYSFSRYLTRVRMEQAKILLKQMDLKTHEISEMVGYNNSRYFNKVFKKFTEMTPFEYRERVLNHE